MNNNYFGTGLVRLYAQTIDYARTPLHEHVSSYNIFNTTLYRKHIYKTPEGKFLQCRETVFTPYLYKGLEFSAKRIAAPLAVLAGSVTVLPLGFALKGTHYVCRTINNKMLSLHCVKTAIKIWNDESLYGDFFTKITSKVYSYSLADFTWNLRPDGQSDRRVERCIYNSDGTSTVMKSEYKYVPIELFEGLTRWVGGGSLTVLTCAFSSLGFASKVIHNLAKGKPLEHRI